MSNSYGMNYGMGDNQMYAVQNQQQYPQYQNYGRNKSIAGTVLGGAAVGFIGGTAVTAGVDYFKNRKPVSGGEVTDSFALNLQTEKS